MSLATILTRVLDGVLDNEFGHLVLNDAQFGFRSGCSTKTDILCLKHTVQ